MPSENTERHEAQTQEKKDEYATLNEELRKQEGLVGQLCPEFLEEYETKFPAEYKKLKIALKTPEVGDSKSPYQKMLMEAMAWTLEKQAVKVVTAGMDTARTVIVEANKYASSAAKKLGF